MLKKSKIVLVSAVMGGLLLAGAISAKAAVDASAVASTTIGAQVKVSQITLELDKLESFVVDPGEDDLIYDDSLDLAHQAKVTRTASLVARKFSADDIEEEGFIYNGTVAVEMKNVGEGHLADLVKMSVVYSPEKDAEKQTSSVVGAHEIRVNTWGNKAGENTVDVVLEWNTDDEDAINAVKTDQLTISMQFVQLDEVPPTASVLAGYRAVGSFQENEWDYATGVQGVVAADQNYEEQLAFTLSIPEGGAQFKFNNNTGESGWVGFDKVDTSNNGKGTEGDGGNIYLPKGEYTAYLKYNEGDGISIYIAEEAQQPEAPQAHKAKYYFSSSISVTGHLLVHYWGEGLVDKNAEIYATGDSVTFEAGYTGYMIVRTPAETWADIVWEGENENVWGNTGNLVITDGEFDIDYGTGEQLVLTTHVEGD